jgi:hypothetical protein
LRERLQEIDASPFVPRAPILFGIRRGGRPGANRNGRRRQHPCHLGSPCFELVDRVDRMYRCIRARPAKSFRKEPS